MIEIFFKEFLFIYFFTLVAYDPEGRQKIERLQNCTKLYLFIYLFYE